MARRIHGVLFDLGDTLVDFGRIDVRTLFEQGARLAYQYLQGLGQPLPPFAKFHRRQNWAIRWNFLKSRLTRREFNSLDVMGRMGSRMGHDLSPEQTLELAWLWYEPLSRQAKVEPGTSELLASLRDQGFKLGLVSNTFVPGEVLDRHLRQEHLLDLLPVRVYSCDVRFRKPNRAIFQLALDAAHLRPDETLFVGDSPQPDIAGANAVGMISVLKDPLGRYDGDSRVRPAHRIRTLAELQEIVAAYR